MDLDDCEQAAVIAAYSRYVSGEPPSHVRQAVNNAVLEYRRSLVGRTTRITTRALFPGNLSELDAQAAYKEIPAHGNDYLDLESRMRVDWLISLVPSPSSQDILRQWLDGNTLKQIALDRGTTESAVHHRIKYAMAQIRAAMPAEGQ